MCARSSSKIRLPKYINSDLGGVISNVLEPALNERIATLDISEVKFAYPSGTLAVGSAIRRFINDRMKRKLYTSVAGKDDSNPAHTFLDHIGFFDFIGLPSGKKMGTAPGNNDYVPIRRYAKEDLVYGRLPMHDAIMTKAQELATVLIGVDPQNPIFRAVLYSLKEILRNVFEHSGADECFVTAQRLRQTGRVELAVIDEGMGIRTSLGRAVDCSSDLDAIKKAIQPGVSRTMRMSFQENAHSNSGFGLYVLAELGRNFGQFILNSGSATLRIESGKPADEMVNAGHQGTLAAVRLDRSINSFDGVLSDIVDAGERDAEDAGVTARASRASRELNLEN